MNPAQKALWFIESHLADALTLDEIAAIGGVSRFHMVRAFAAATGLSVMRYVRARRLSEAARALASGAPDILSAGAGGGLRLARSIHPRVPRPFRGHARSGPRLDASRPSQTSGADRHGFNRTRQSSSRRVLRPASRCSSPASANAITMGMAAPAFPASGSAFIKSVHEHSRPDREGRLWRLLQRRRCRQFRLHRRRRSVRLLRSAARIQPACGFPNRNTRSSPISDHISTIRRTINTIWNHWLPASGLKAADAPNFERYDENFDPLTGDGGLEIWIPVRTEAPCQRGAALRGPMSVIAWQAIATLP